MSTEQLFKCDSCEQSFKSKLKLKSHTLEHFSIQCEICSKPFNNERGLKIHLKSHEKQYNANVQSPSSSKLKQLTTVIQSPSSAVKRKKSSLGVVVPSPQPSVPSPLVEAAAEKKNRPTPEELLQRLPALNIKVHKQSNTNVDEELKKVVPIDPIKSVAPSLSRLAVNNLVSNESTSQESPVVTKKSTKRKSAKKDVSLKSETPILKKPRKTDKISNCDKLLPTKKAKKLLKELPKDPETTKEAPKYQIPCHCVQCVPCLLPCCHNPAVRAGKCCDPHTLGHCLQPFEVSFYSQLLVLGSGFTLTIFTRPSVTHRAAVLMKVSKCSSKTMSGSSMAILSTLSQKPLERPEVYWWKPTRMESTKRRTLYAP